VTSPKLRVTDHPDLSDFVVHFTGRNGARRGVHAAIRNMTPEQRLRQILIDRKIRASVTFYAASPVVCFTECTMAGLAYLIASGRCEPWGIVFDKQAVWDRQGGPAFYVRGDDWDEAEKWTEPLRSRAVKFEPGRHEWVEEREWRAPGAGRPAGFAFERREVQAVLTPEWAWPPSESSDPEEIPAWAPGVPHWWWDGRARQIKPIAHWPRPKNRRNP